ncbi:MAG: carotenoid biosynthesis protein [bacterium]
MHGRTHAPAESAFDRKFISTVLALLGAAIVFFTYLHFYQPQILRVPSNTDVSSWTNPAFEQTCIYDRMTAEERQRVLEQGIPLNTVSNLIVAALFSVVCSWLCFAHARKHYGRWMAWCFLFGSFVFTGAQESMWILFGRFMGRSAMSGLAQDPSVGTYWFTRGALWFIETPVEVCLGWFFVAYGCVWIASRVFPATRLLGRAAVGGLIAMTIDLWEDPVATSPELMSWVWAKGDFLRIFGIPHTNFLGWFLLIFLFAIFWEWLPSMERRWGRGRATLAFFGIVVATEAAILIFMLVWCSAFQSLLAALGFQQGIQIPQGW